MSSFYSFRFLFKEHIKQRDRIHHLLHARITHAGKDGVLERIERLEDSIEKASREIAATDSDKIEARIVSLREMLAALNDGSLPADKVNIILKQFIDRIEYTNYAPPRTRKNDIRLDVFLLS